MMADDICIDNSLSLSPYFQLNFALLPLQKHPVSLYNTCIVIVVSAYVKFIFEVLPLVSSYNVNLAVTVFLCGSAVVCVLFLLKTLKRELLILCFIIVTCLTILAKKRLGRNAKQETYLPAGLDIVRQFGLTSVVCILLSYSSTLFKNVYSKNIRTHAKEIDIRMISIEVADTTFPRLHNIYSWFKRNNLDLLPSYNTKSGQYNITQPHIVLLWTNQAPDLKLLTSKIGKKDKEKVFTSTTKSCIKDDLTMFSKNMVPVLLLCHIAIDGKGHIEKQARRLISYIEENCHKFTEINVLYMVKGTKDFKLNLEEISFEIQRKLRTNHITNNIFCRTYTMDEPKLKEGIGLYLEQSLTRYILEIAKRNQTSKIMSNTLTNIRNRKFQQFPLETTATVDWKVVVSEFQPRTPDNCEMHELEVLLERYLMRIGKAPCKENFN